VSFGRLGLSGMVVGLWNWSWSARTSAACDATRPGDPREVALACAEAHLGSNWYSGVGRIGGIDRELLEESLPWLSVVGIRYRRVDPKAMCAWSECADQAPCRDWSVAFRNASGKGCRVVDVHLGAGVQVEHKEGVCKAIGTRCGLREGAEFR
jgi:hypothetical protein